MEIDVGALYEFVNIIISPWLIVGLAIVQLVLVTLLNKIWRLHALSLVHMSAVVTIIVYIVFGLGILVDLSEVRVLGRITVALLVVSFDIFLLAALREGKKSLEKNQ